jgi:predicted aminopeptidase
MSTTTNMSCGLTVAAYFNALIKSSLGLDLRRAAVSRRITDVISGSASALLRQDRFDYASTRTEMAHNKLGAPDSSPPKRNSKVNRLTLALCVLASLFTVQLAPRVFLLV